jgi:hypothetical protein
MNKSQKALTSLQMFFINGEIRERIADDRIKADELPFALLRTFTYWPPGTENPVETRPVVLLNNETLDAVEWVYKGEPEYYSDVTYINIKVKPEYKMLPYAATHSLTKGKVWSVWGNVNDDFMDAVVKAYPPPEQKELIKQDRISARLDVEKVKVPIPLENLRYEFGVVLNEAATRAAFALSVLLERQGHKSALPEHPASVDLVQTGVDTLPVVGFTIGEYARAQGKENPSQRERERLFNDLRELRRAEIEIFCDSGDKYTNYIGSLLPLGIARQVGKETPTGDIKLIPDGSMFDGRETRIYLAPHPIFYQGITGKGKFYALTPADIYKEFREIMGEGSKPDLAVQVARYFIKTNISPLPFGLINFAKTVDVPRSVMRRGKPSIRKRLKETLDYVKQAGYLLDWTYDEKREIYTFTLNPNRCAKLGKRLGLRE